MDDRFEYRRALRQNGLVLGVVQFSLIAILASQAVCVFVSCEPVWEAAVVTMALMCTGTSNAGGICAALLVFIAWEGGPGSEGRLADARRVADIMFGIAVGGAGIALLLIVSPVQHLRDSEPAGGMAFVRLLTFALAIGTCGIQVGLSAVIAGLQQAESPRPLPAPVA